MISVREALDLVLRDLPLLDTETVAVPEGSGRALAEEVAAAYDVPPFRNSAMDGYAVRSADVAGAGKDSPAKLRVLEVVGAGSLPSRPVEPATATKIMTGSPMPEQADAVVRVEDTREAGEEVQVLSAVAAGANVRDAGEDVRAGERVLAPGRRLRPADIGVLASLGLTAVRVRRRPQVAILATGNELVELGRPLGAGQIVNSNAYALAAAVEECGGVARRLGIVPDTPRATRAAFEEAFSCDLVLSTGGVSMGTFDLVRATLADLGVQERFWKVAQKPGKPLAFGLRDGTPVFGLPGNPVSALVCFYVYVRPALQAMLGLHEVHLPVAPAVAAVEMKTAGGVTEFVRCTVAGAAGAYEVRPTGSQSSGVLRSMSLGQGLVVAPPEVTTIQRGSEVRVLLLAGQTCSACPPV